jgi:hypothetical protein
MAVMVLPNQHSPELQAFASLLDAQSPEIQEALQSLPATAMHEAARFEPLGVVQRSQMRSGGHNEVN